MNHETVETVLLVISFLSLAVFLSIALKKIRIPYTIGLVIVGILLGWISQSIPIIQNINLTPEIILYIILPTLIYDAAINIDARVLKRNIGPILLLAILGVLLSTAVISGLLSFTSISIGGALLFGALISATDPVAVIALFEEIGAPRRLVTLIDGESIFNDATAIVLFNIILAAVMQGTVFSGTMLAKGVVQFCVVLLGGLAVGTLIGLVGAVVMRAQKNNLIVQVTVSLIMAYVSFIVADHFLGVSGVMSTFAAGITSKILTDAVVNTENYHHVESFWTYFSFVANSFVFLVLGLTEAHTFTDGSILQNMIVPMLWVVPIVTVARILVVYTLIPLYNKMFADKKISWAFQHILFVGGLRGAVPVALVLAIPPSFSGREYIIHLTFGFILFTLVVQGTSMKSLMNRLGITPDKSFFDSHKGIVSSYDFPTESLVELITSRLIDGFEEERFLITAEHTHNRQSFFIRKGQKGIQIDAEGLTLKITAEPGLVNYTHQMLSETLIELNHSVSKLQKIVNPDELQKIIKPSHLSQTPQEFNLVGFIKENSITLHLKSESKNDLIEELLEIAVENGSVHNQEAAFKALLEREESMTTGIGGGLAIPHAKCDFVDKITLVVGLKKNGIDFDSIDKKPAKLFFLILSPRQEVGPHMQLLAALSRQVAAPGVMDQIIASTTKKEVIKLLTMRS
jgi:CPA1 family monovalent cation:H+ antiporter